MAQDATILLVDDNDVELDQVGLTLLPSFKVKKARSAEEARRLLGDDIHVICVSFRPGGFDAIGLAREAAAHACGAVPVVITTYDDYSKRSLESGRKDDKFYLVFRPYKPEQLLDVVKRAAQTQEMKRQMRRVTEMARARGAT